MPLAKRKIWLSTMRKQLLELCFSTSATELSMESAAPTSAVICIENGRSTTTGIAYKELIFFGNSALCLNHALHCSGMADSIMVIGTRSREHVALQLDFYLLQLMKSIDPLGC